MSSQGHDPVTQWGLVIEGFQITNRKLHRAVAEAFSLDPAETETVLRLGRSSHNRMTMAALAREAAFSTGGFTKIADRLAKRGLVERGPGAALADELQLFVSSVVRENYIDVLGADRAATVAEAMAALREHNA